MLTPLKLMKPFHGSIVQFTELPKHLFRLRAFPTNSTAVNCCKEKKPIERRLSLKRKSIHARNTQ